MDLPWTSAVPLIKDPKALKAPKMRPAIVVVYSPECGWSKKAQETIDKAVAHSSKLRGHVFRYNAVPSDKPAEFRAAHAAWPAAFPGIEIQKYPTVLVFSGGPKSFTVHEFQKSVANYDQGTVPMLESLLK